MKDAVLLLIMVMAFVSCKKSSNNITVSPPQYFEFGYAGGLAGVHKTFVIKDGLLYPEDTTHSPLSNVKYVEASKLITDFPAYLIVRPDQQFGCPNCADDFFISIKIRKNGITQTWSMSTDTSALPIALRGYTSEVYAVTNEL